MIKLKNTSNKKIKDVFRTSAEETKLEIEPLEIKRMENRYAEFLLKKYSEIENRSATEGSPDYPEEITKPKIEEENPIKELLVDKLKVKELEVEKLILPTKLNWFKRLINKLRL